MPDWIIYVLKDPLWTGGATWGAGVITAVGLCLTYWQAGKARKAAEAARQASVRTVRELSRSDHLAELGEAGQLTARIKDYAAVGNPQAVRMALEMLRVKIDSLEATADGEHATNSENRGLDRILGILERHADEAAVSMSGGLDASMVSHQLNEVRRVLSRRVQRMKRAVPEDTDV